MSQLLAPAHTYQGAIPLWIRIRELMKEKGSSHSITAMAARIGISRETLRVMLNGDREIYWFELEKIAQDLKVPLKRLLMEDLEEQKNREQILQHVANNQMEAAMQAAKKRLSFAITPYETAQSYSLIAYVHFWAGEYELAKSFYSQMRPIAEEIYQRYQHQELLSSCLSNLLNIAVELRQYENVPELLDATEPFFQNSPVKMGMWHYAKGRWKHSINQREQAKGCYLQCLAQMRLTKNADAIGRAIINLACAEYADRNYSRAKELLMEAVGVSTENSMQAAALKELAKTQIKLKEFQAAEELIRNTLQAEWFQKFPDMKGRFLILLSRATGNVRHAKAAASHLGYSMPVRYHAYRYLELENLRRGAAQRVSTRQRSRGHLPKRRFPLDTIF